MKTRRVKHLLLQCLGDRSMEVRSQAARGLGCIASKQAVTPLVGALDNSVWWVRRNAAEALAKIGKKSLKVPRPPKEKAPNAPIPVVEIISRAKGYLQRLKSGEFPSMRKLAQAEDLSPGRMSQILSILKLNEELLEVALSSPPASRITERQLRPLTKLPPEKQMEGFLSRFGNIFGAGYKAF